MDVALVSHVEHQPVARGIKHPVDGHRQFHHAQIRRQMPAAFRHMLHQKSAQLVAKLAGLGRIQPLHIRRAVNHF